MMLRLTRRLHHMLPMTVAFCVATLCGRAEAQRIAHEPVASIASLDTQEVVVRLDAMLPSPTIPLELVIDSTADPLEALATAQTRYVVVVSTRSIVVVDRADRRVVSRVLEEGLAERSPYAVALVAIELLEVVGAVEPEESLEPVPVVEEPVVDDPVVEEPPVTPPPVEAPGPALTISFGGVATRAIDGDIDPVLAEAGVGVDLPVGRFVLSLGASIRFPGRSVENRTTSNDVGVRFELVRTDLALRAAFGGENDRFGYRAFGVLGPARVHARARTREEIPQEGSATRASAFIGLGLEGRIALIDALWLTCGASVEWLPGATPYGALGEFLVDEPHFRVLGSVALVWRLDL